jgi:1-acyl-sn-glycerol-3-phosphate acyltransferase
VTGAPAGARAARLGPGPVVYHAVRLFLRGVSAAYVRIRVEGVVRLPADGPYVICFNHPSWLDPIVLAASWPDRRRRLFIFGPREADMSVGPRNRLITWTGRGVPFKPGGADVVDATRRSVAVLRGGDCLAIAGEGRLSDREGELLPLETGPAHLAQMTGAPIVPVAVIGTRWVHLGKRIRVVIGEPVDPALHPRGRVGAASMTAEVTRRLEALLAGVTDGPRPGPFGAWLSEAFNERPWLTAEDDAWR